MHYQMKLQLSEADPNPGVPRTHGRAFTHLGLDVLNTSTTNVCAGITSSQGAALLQCWCMCIFHCCNCSKGHRTSSFLPTHHTCPAPGPLFRNWLRCRCWQSAASTS